MQQENQVSKYEKRPQPEHQQTGGMTIKEFATVHDITEDRVRVLIKAKRIVGVSQHPLSHQYTIFPPARIVELN
jgi:hypothetical protein